MPRQSQATRPTGNHLLDALPPDELSLLRPHLEPVEIRVFDILCEVEEPARFVYFPTSCILSSVTPLEDGGMVEAVTVGREGMIPLSVALRVPVSSMKETGQVAGEALRMPANLFAEILRETPVLNALLIRYTEAVVKLLAQTVACNRIHRLEKRCARWLLLSHDRLGSDDLPLTHEVLATMLGTHRPNVSLALKRLEDANLIEGRRGYVKVKDRKALEAFSCECYEAIAHRFQALAEASRFE